MLNQIPSIDDAVQSIIDEFSLFDDWIERYEYIIELGEKLSGLSEAQKTETNRVRGCQSQVWFVATRVEDRIHFDADSDAMIVRGLIALLLRVYSDRTPQEIAATPPDFFEAVDLGSHLSGNRANGLAAMINHIRSFSESSTQ
ncbi:MAG: SufE family protein [Pseudomonadota bacterium]|nr:SufE family protein [Pseudomonadota bacterium]